jgi:predicted dithiol-disulfide oxidoreductase (DUF899 family)
MTESNTQLLHKKIDELEEKLINQHHELVILKKQLPREEVADYELQGQNGAVKLSALFGDKKVLIIIHNMGTSCPYCTLWADGFNGVINHIKDRAACALVSPDSPDKQKKFADSRGWDFDVYSGDGSSFIQDMGYQDGADYRPGVSTFYKENDATIYRIAKAPFGSFDSFCGVWHLFTLLSDGVNDWNPQYKY